MSSSLKLGILDLQSPCASDSGSRLKLGLSGAICYLLGGSGNYNWGTYTLHDVTYLPPKSKLVDVIPTKSLDTNEARLYMAVQIEETTRGCGGLSLLRLHHVMHEKRSRFGNRRWEVRASGIRKKAPGLGYRIEGLE